MLLRWWCTPWKTGQKMEKYYLSARAQMSSFPFLHQIYLGAGAYSTILGEQSIELVFPKLSIILSITLLITMH